MSLLQAQSFEEIERLSKNSADKSGQIALLEAKLKDLDDRQCVVYALKERTTQYTKAQEELARLEQERDGKWYDSKNLDEELQKLRSDLAIRDKDGIADTSFHLLILRYKPI